MLRPPLLLVEGQRPAPNICDPPGHKHACKLVERITPHIFLIGMSTAMCPHMSGDAIRVCTPHKSAAHLQSICGSHVLPQYDYTPLI